MNPTQCGYSLAVPHGTRFLGSGSRPASQDLEYRREWSPLAVDDVRFRP